MSERAKQELTRTQSERQGAQGTYSPDEVAAFELGARYAMDLLHSRIAYSDSTPKYVLDEMRKIMTEKDEPKREPLEGLHVPRTGFQQGGLNE